MGRSVVPRALANRLRSLTVDHQSCEQSCGHGVENGQTVAQAVELLKSAPWPHADVEAPVVGRTFIHGVLCIDSISLGNSEDAGLVVASGSHGGAMSAGMTSSFRPRSLSSMMPASASIARVLPAFLFSILRGLPPLRSPRIRRVSVMASQR
jgi:hypothetical protein